MGTAERRKEIMRLLCVRRHDTISNLAYEFGVSERTIARDIDILSSTEPIYTQCGRYHGGVYVIDNYYMDRMYMTASELTVLHKFAALAQESLPCSLNNNEKNILNELIKQYTKPNYKPTA